MVRSSTVSLSVTDRFGSATGTPKSDPWSLEATDTLDVQSEALPLTVTGTGFVKISGRSVGLGSGDNSIAFAAGLEVEDGGGTTFVYESGSSVNVQ